MTPTERRSGQSRRDSDLGGDVGQRVAKLEAEMDRAQLDVSSTRQGMDGLTALVNTLLSKVDRLEWRGERDDERYDEQKHDLAELTASADKLHGSVASLSLMIRNAESAVPPVVPHVTKQIKDSWASARTRTRLKIAAAVVGVVSAPEVIKGAISALARLLSQVAK